MALQSLDIVRRSATTTPSPQAREASTGEVAKLIDVTKCIGCKACQVACMEWNDLRDEIGINAGVYDNPPDLSGQSWTVMRFAEYENPKGDLEWLIRKDGCMMERGATIPQCGRDGGAEGTGGDARKVGQPRGGRDALRRQSGEGERHQRDEKGRHTDALDDGRDQQRADRGVGVELRAHELLRREDQLVRCVDSAAHW